MTNLTGVLGSRFAQPGRIQLGAGFGDSGVLASHSAAVATTIALVVDQGPWKRLSDPIAVAADAATNADRAEAVSSTITTASAVDPFAGTVEVTQYAVEIIYRKSTSVAMTHAVAVSSIGRTPERQVDVSVTSGIAVGSVLGFSSNHPHLSHAIQVAGAPRGRNNNVRIGVTTAIGIGVPATGRDGTIELPVTDTVNLDDLGRRYENTVPIPGSDSLTVAGRVAFYTNPLAIDSGHLLTVASVVTGGGAQRPVAVMHEVVVGTAADPKRPSHAVEHAIVLTAGASGGGPIREEAVTHTVIPVPEASSRSSRIHQAIRDRIFVTHARVARGPEVPITVVTEVRAQPAPIGAAPRRLSVADPILVASGPVPRSTVVRLPVTSEVTVADANRKNIVSLAVGHAVTTSARPWTPDLVVISRIQVSQDPRRVREAAVVNPIAVTPAVDRRVLFNPTLVDPLPVADSVVRGAILDRSVAQALPIPEGMYRARIFLPDPITVPVAVGTLVTKYNVLQSRSGAIVLPAPLLGDGQENSDAITVHRSMRGGALVFKASNSRRRLRLQFRLDKVKAFELREFLQANLSEPITMTTFDGQKWVVLIPRAPAEIQHAGRAAGADEFATWEVEMEGQKISG